MNRSKKVSKLIFYISSFAVCIYILTPLFKTSDFNPDIVSNIKIETALNKENYVKRNHRQRIKYILLWTPPNHSPFNLLEEGQSIFIRKKCTLTNCYITSDRKFLKGDYRNFDAIAFNGHELIRNNISLPQLRSPKQKYIFAELESSHNYPACDPILDKLFNWTFTYKLDSDVQWRYFAVYDVNNTEVGPRKEMNWLLDMDPISENLKTRLNSKSKAAAWFVSHCHSKSGRERFVREVQNELKRYNLTVDVFGSCGPYRCPRARMDECYKLLERDYYFYFSMENSFSEDYVTEKLLHALNHDAVPVVYGGANYSRFLPPGSYLDARALGPARLAATMHELMQNPALYYDYFRWRNHYSYQQPDSFTTTCNLCAALNDEKMVSKNSVYNNFREWWNPKLIKSCNS